MTEEASQPAIDVEYRSALINRVLAEIEARYVFPQVGTEMVAAIRRRREDGEYDAIDNGAGFGSTLTTHL